MTKPPEETVKDLARVEITDEDIVEAMKRIPGYLDITPHDFKAIYVLAFEHALERLGRSVAARDIMTREVAAVRTDTPLSQVAKLMGEQGVSGLPVLNEADKVVGVISEKDFLVRLGVKEPKNFMSVVAECLEVKKCVALPLRERTAAEVMSAPPVTVREDTPMSAIAQLFTERAINRVPVTDSRGLLVGLVSRADIVRATRQGAAS